MAGCFGTRFFKKKNMKYKLINTENKAEFVCEKIEIHGFEYYVIDSHLDNHFKIKKSDLSISERGRIRESGWDKYYTIISTNNPTIDIPQVVDEVEEMCDKINNNDELANKEGKYLELFEQKKPKTIYFK